MAVLALILMLVQVAALSAQTPVTYEIDYFRFAACANPCSGELALNTPVLSTVRIYLNGRLLEPSEIIVGKPVTSSGTVPVVFAGPVAPTDLIKAIYHLQSSQ